jgi:outer membrane protein TolC
MRRVCGLFLVFVLFCQSSFAQQGRGATLSPNLFGSVSQGAPMSGTISISIADAIDRALKYNLAPILSEQETNISRAARLRALSELLPKFAATLTENVEQINLAAFGFNGFPGQPLIVGPFSLFDVRAHYAQTLDFRLLHELRSSAERVTAANYGQQDVRELVVLITTELYLQTIAASSRLDAVRAQLKTAEAVYQRAVDLKNSGVAPGIDVLRAQVDMQTQQQRVLVAENDFATQKLNLARAIGLPQGQAYTQSDTFISDPQNTPLFDQAFATALDTRPDYKRSQALIRAAEQARQAAVGRRLPTLQVNTDYGAIGRTPGFSHGTVNVGGTLLVPIYTGERAKAEIQESESLLEQRKAESSNLRDRIEYDVRTANLDIQSAAEQVRVARAARDLSQQQLTQAQDRFAAGVTNGLEVTQAQEAVARADENYIAGLYSLNVAEATLARAMGTAERSIKSLFGGK